MSMKVEIGYFFCGNCSHVDKKHVNLPYKSKPKTDCVVCRFQEYIFEPTGELEEFEVSK